MRHQDIPYSDWKVITALPSDLQTRHEDSQQRLMGILFRAAGDLVAVPSVHGVIGQPIVEKTLTVKVDEFHPIDPDVIKTTTTALPLVLFYGPVR